MFWFLDNKRKLRCKKNVKRKQKKKIEIITIKINVNTPTALSGVIFRNHEKIKCNNFLSPLERNKKKMISYDYCHCENTKEIWHITSRSFREGIALVPIQTRFRLYVRIISHYMVSPIILTTFRNEKIRKKNKIK